MNLLWGHRRIVMTAPANKIEARLFADQRATQQRLVRTGTHPAHARRRAANCSRV
jgi:hypothetical protein